MDYTQNTVSEIASYICSLKESGCSTMCCCTKGEAISISILYLQPNKIYPHTDHEMLIKKIIPSLYITIPRAPFFSVQL